MVLTSNDSQLPIRVRSVDWASSMDGMSFDVQRVIAYRDGVFRCPKTETHLPLLYR